MRFNRTHGGQFNLLYEVLRKKAVDFRVSRQPDGTWVVWWEGDASLGDQHEEWRYVHLAEAIQRISGLCGEPLLQDSARAVADAILAVSHATRSEFVRFSAHPEDESPCTLAFHLDLGAYVRPEIVLGDETGPKLLKQLHNYLNKVAVECSKRALAFHHD